MKFYKDLFLRGIDPEFIISNFQIYNGASILPKQQQKKRQPTNPRRNPENPKGKKLIMRKDLLAWIEKNRSKTVEDIKRQYNGS